MIRALTLCGIVLAGAAFAETSTPAEGGADEPLSVATVFTDNMVLQRGKPVPVWGWAAPGSEVVVRLADQEKHATVEPDGKWMVKLDALTAGGGPLEMTVEGKTKIVFKNILVGEVWVCSGQSNMALLLSQVANGEQEAAAADLPEIRVFRCWGEALIEPQPRGQGAWTLMTPAVAKNTSAVAFFFARKLHQELNVPIGLIIAAVGGTYGEAWTSRQGLEQNPQLKFFVDQIDKTVASFPPKNDEGWDKPDFDDTAWKTMKVPVNWQQGGVPGSGCVWFRKSVDIPAGWAGKALTFHSGPLRRSDVTWFNGHKIGETTEAPERPREYTIPAQWVKAGRAVLATRITSHEYWAGMLGKPEEFKLSVAGAEGADFSISLAGDWKFEVAKLFNVGNSSMATTLYNGFIAPVVPYAIQGVVWYQGEGNVARASQYRLLLPTLIRDWRAHWGQGDFPFGIVQLPSFGDAKSTLGPCDWAELREAQFLAAKTVPHTGLAVTIDNADRDMHSKTKEDVGLRLGLWALATVYGKNGVYSGPIYRTMAIEGSKIRLTFEQVGSGLEAKGGALKEFAIAGDDQKFVWADAVIDGNTVVVSSDKVPAPTAVRYAWSTSPGSPNLYNKEGLPASPFRTDDWPGIDLISLYKKANEVARKQEPPVQLIFDGDSITYGWHYAKGAQKIWDDHYGKIGAFNFGIPGARTEQLLRRIPYQVEGLHPKLIVLLIGTNDTPSDSAEVIAQKIKAVVESYRQNCPDATILLQGIFPRGEKPANPSRAKIKEINQRIATFADGKKVLFIDFGDKFLQPDGSISPAMMSDFLHIGAQGYQIWADAIQPVLNQYMR